MKEQFVTYEIALKLKELGFDEGCLAYYGDNILIFDKHEYLECDIKVNYVLGWKYEMVTLAPLWQQVIDWFRSKYKLSISVFPISSNRWFYSIRKYKEAPDFNYKDVISSPYPVGFAKETSNEAREQAILKAIELCQKQIN